MRLLTCYNPNTPLAIGERYGFRVWDRSRGYEYLTGGAGLVLSKPLVHEMVQPGKCDCPSATTPDDMYLFGICLTRIGVQPVHSQLFHQVCNTYQYMTQSLEFSLLPYLCLKLYIYFRLVLPIMHLPILRLKNLYLFTSFG